MVADNSSNGCTGRQSVAYRFAVEANMLGLLADEVQTLAAPDTTAVVEVQIGCRRHRAADRREDRVGARRSHWSFVYRRSCVVQRGF